MGFTNLNDGSAPTGNGGGAGSGGNGGGPLAPTPPLKAMTGQMNSIEELLINYNVRFKDASPALFRDPQIAQAISVLIGKSKPNPLLIGPAGVGKTRIVEEIARCIANKSPLIPSRLAGSTIYELPLANLVAGAGVVGQLEERVTELVDWAVDPQNDVILFIDEAHQLQNSSDPVLKKVAQILKPALARGEMRLIAATTMNEAQAFDSDPAFQRRFTRLIVDELTREQTLEILLSVRGSYVQHYGMKVSISDEVLTKLAVIADENSRASSHRPDSALTLLDRAMADTVVGHSTAIAKAEAAGDAHAVNALKAITTMPLGEKKVRSVAVRLMTGLAAKEPFDETRVLDKLGRIKGQESIVGDLVDALRRDDLGAFPRTKPLAWMFAGPSGVGKTEIAKIIAQELTNQAPITLNMGEYNNEHDVSRLLGSGPGYIGSDSNKELPFDTLESNPYRVILLDELEKAHRVIHRLFLTALDEGWMRMANGKVIDFSKTIVIATTNAGRDQLTRKTTGFSISPQRTSVTRAELTRILKEVFEPEFLGRFTKLIAFSELTADTYSEILSAAYEREVERIAESDPRTAALITKPIDPQLLQTTVEETYVAELGARPAEQAARRLIEDMLLAARFPIAAAVTGTAAPGSTGSGENGDV